ncbi:hypothetical protein [Rhizobium sp. CF122]|uniref:hypothetical protein n=1 Tax=Rhizobium sp. CF122 TaxID=1144312 RepID=UPI0002FCAB01|nr:hypothetical protein [Rhizobium sp. CF122]
MEPKHADEMGVLLLRLDGPARVERILDREVSVYGARDDNARSRGDRDPLDRHLAFLGGHVDAAGFRPSSGESFGRASTIVTSLGFSDGERRQIRRTGNPIR